jgi:SNF2 family DNA or RNA helicase
MLILEMGLGKSAVSLTAILDLMFDSFDVDKVLVIAPLRVAKTVWPEERDTWEHAHFLKMSVMVGSAKQRETALRTPADIYVVNRENLKWLTDYLEKRGIPWPFDMVVIDELSSFKNHQSQRWKALRKVRPQIKRMVGLTGTPASNGLLDLWAETFLIDKGIRLGRFIGRFREAYFKPAGMNPYTGVVFNYVPLPGAEEAIYSRIADIAVSMKALDYLDMPEQVTVNHYVDMDEVERELYDEMKKGLLVEIGDDKIDAAVGERDLQHQRIRRQGLQTVRIEKAA